MATATEPASDLTRQPPRWLRPLQGATLAGVVALGVLPFALDVMRDARVPEPSAVAAATAAIRAGFQDGDAVYTTPTWYTLPWHGLERMGPGTEAWPYPALLLSEELDPLEALKFRRLWVIGAFDRDAAAPEAIADVATGRVDVPLGVANVALARYDLPRVERLRTLSQDGPNLRVSRGAPEAKPCRWRGDRHRCGREPWLDLFLHDRIVYHHQVQWLMTHPSPGGEPLDIAWPDLPAGGTWLYLRAGWTMEAVRHPDGTDTHVAVLVDGRQVDQFTLEPRRYWLERRAYPLTGAAPVTVTLRVWADEPGHRELMLEADVLATLPDPLRRWATFVGE